MTQSFSSTEPLGRIERTGRRRVLVTGAAGNIGSYFAENSHARYDLRLMVQAMDAQTAALQTFGEVVAGDLLDLDRMKALCAGIDTVLHLAADASPNATWASLLDANIVGAYNIMVAAKAAGCRRLVFASSIHAVSGYPADVQVKTNDPVNPGDLYGVTKCFGEALGRYMAEQEGLSVIALRIGAFQPRETVLQEGSVRLLDAFVSRRDLNQLIERCIDVENIRFAILHGLSDNRFKRLDISDARTLVGYDPQDDLTSEHPKLKELQLDETIQAHNLSDPNQKSGIREEL
ncbi:MAG TPA: NAD(P)-dependent oxidoreductase [Ardenticatenaceae bacterium]|nr:NAD(P)-dependent oxidoreductase [Ardenticatenaceae bacterium]